MQIEINWQGFTVTLSVFYESFTNVKFEFTEKSFIFNFFFSFQDQQNKTALPVIHLIDSMQSGVIDYKIVKSGSKLTKEVINISWKEYRVSNIKIAQIDIEGSFEIVLMKKAILKLFFNFSQNDVHIV